MYRLFHEIVNQPDHAWAFLGGFHHKRQPRQRLRETNAASLSGAAINAVGPECTTLHQTHDVCVRDPRRRFIAQK
jgi:hypothetical protein